MNPLDIAGLVGGIGQLFGTSSANKKLQALQQQNDALADNKLGLATTLLNARTPGAAMAEKNIFANQANQVGRVNQNATSSSDAILADSNIGGQTNDALNKLQTSETSDFQRRYGNLQDAQQSKLQSLEGDAQIEGAQSANKYNTWGNISNMGFGLASVGLAGGFKNLFGKGSGNTSSAIPYDYGTNSLYQLDNNYPQQTQV